MRKTGFMNPPSLIGTRFWRYEDLEALSERPTDELCKLECPTELEGAVKLTPPFTPEEKLSARRIMLARLFAGLVSLEDEREVERVLVTAIDEGRWPSWRSDFKIIRLAIRGCGFMPGYPLSDRAKETLAETDRRRAREAAQADEAAA